MREILFRGKTTRNGEWVYGSLINVDTPSGSFCCILEQDYGDRYEYPYLDAELGVIDGQAIPVVPETVGQYIGYKDKNGKKVFEGDILEFVWPSGKLERRVISYHGAGYTYCDCHFYRDEVYDDYIEDGEYGMIVEWREIIGNIYDNPELMVGR